VPGGVRRQTASSFQRAEDAQRARRLILWHLPGDPETQPGSTGPTPSELVLEEVRTRGEAAVVIGAISRRDGGGFGVLGGLFAGRKYFRGTVKRVGLENVRVLLDGAQTSLSTIHASGTVSVGDDSGNVEFWWLNDPATRFALKFGFQGSTAQIVRIDRPSPTDQASVAARSRELQQSLASKACRAEVPGVYFLTDSAELLPASDSAVERIADVLRKQQDWKVTIEGHTDSTGGDAHNLDLSRRRAEALRRHSLLEASPLQGCRRQDTAGRGPWTRTTRSKDEPTTGAWNCRGFVDSDRGGTHEESPRVGRRTWSASGRLARWLRVIERHDGRRFRQ
jgi:outer membrane protein OmpA-like peptidoglycan-associated protein